MGRNLFRGTLNVLTTQSHPDAAGSKLAWRIHSSSMEVRVLATAIFFKRGAFLPLISIKQRCIPSPGASFPLFWSFTWRTSHCFSESFRFRDNCGNELPLDSCHQALKLTPSLCSSSSRLIVYSCSWCVQCGNFKDDSDGWMKAVRSRNCV